MQKPSALIPQDFIQELLARCDIVSLIDERIPLRKKGKSYLACCPFHHEKTPSFNVMADKQFYYCFGCSASGNAISFLIEYERLSFPEAVEQLAERCGLMMPTTGASFSSSSTAPLYDVLDQVTLFYQEQLRKAPHAIHYLQQRGLTGSTAKKFNLGYAPPGWDNLLKQGFDRQYLKEVGLLLEKEGGGRPYDRFRDRIIFPIRDKRGRIIAFGGRLLKAGEPKYLNSPETRLFHKNKELYGLDRLYLGQKAPPFILVVEGYMDVLALHQANIPQCVATLGTATRAEQIRRLFSLTQEVIFCFDGDSAGRKAAWRVLEMSLSVLQDGYSLRFLILPEGEDPDSFVRKKSRAAFMECLDQAQYLGDFLFEGCLEQIDMTQLEGKARFVKRVVPLLEQISPGILQYKLFEKLATFVNMDTQTLKQLAGSMIVPVQKNKTVRKPAAYPAALSPMRLAIALIVQHPELVHTLSELQIQALSTLNLPGSELLIDLITRLKTLPVLNSGQLLEYFRHDSARTQILTSLLHYPLSIPPTGLEREFHDLLRHLEKETVQKKIDQLLQKGKQFALTEGEKKQLYQLILSAQPEKQ